MLHLGFDLQAIMFWSEEFQFYERFLPESEAIISTVKKNNWSVLEELSNVLRGKPFISVRCWMVTDILDKAYQDYIDSK